MPPVVAPTPELKTCVIKATPQARWSKAESNRNSDIGDIKQSTCGTHSPL